MTMNVAKATANPKNIGMASNARKPVIKKIATKIAIIEQNAIHTNCFKFIAYTSFL